MQKLRVGVLGCGLIAQHHLRFLRQSKLAQVVALADQNRESTQRLGERYGIAAQYRSLETMLKAEKLDVLHILTPPSYHYEQALAAIENRCHVFIEKPITFKSRELQHLYKRADACGVSLCPDFIQLFHPKAAQAVALIESGELGRPIHVESALCVNPDQQPELREAVGLRWNFQLPGGLLHNYITHPLYMVLRVTGDPQQIETCPQSLGKLPRNVTDHLAVAIRGRACTGSILVSLAGAYDRYDFAIHCERGVVLVDFRASTLVVLCKSRLPSSVARVSSTLAHAGQLAAETSQNVIDYARGKLVPYQGLGVLLEAYYKALLDSTSPPISRGLAIAVTAAEEEIFEKGGALQIQTAPRPNTQSQVQRSEKLVVTGATGFVGTAVVRQLVADGYYVRAMVRPLSHTQELEQLGVEIVYGDVLDEESVVRAADGADIVVHLAAGLRGTSRFMLQSCVEGTANVARAAKRAGVCRVIYLSSLSVHDYTKLQNGEVITESSPLEEHAESRGTYSLAKRQAEDIALAQLSGQSPSWTILRPSLILGRQSNVFSPVGKQVGRTLICFGPGSKNLRLIHVDDVAAAVVRAIQVDGTRGGIFTLSQPEPITMRDYLQRHRQTTGSKYRALHVPYWLAALGVLTLSGLRRVTGKGPAVNLRRLRYLYRDLRASCNAFEKRTDWRPPPTLLDRLFVDPRPVKALVDQDDQAPPRSDSVKAPLDRGGAPHFDADHSLSEPDTQPRHEREYSVRCKS